MNPNEPRELREQRELVTKLTEDARALWSAREIILSYQNGEHDPITAGIGDKAARIESKLRPEIEKLGKLESLLQFVVEAVSHGR